MIIKRSGYNRKPAQGNNCSSILQEKKRGCTSPVSRVTKAHRRHSGNNMSKHRCVEGEKNPSGSRSELPSALPSIRTASGGLLQFVRVKYTKRRNFKPTAKGYLQRLRPQRILPPCILGLNSFLFRSQKNFDKLLLAIGTAVAEWLRCCATNRKIAGSIPDCVIGIKSF